MTLCNEHFYDLQESCKQTKDLQRSSQGSLYVHISSENMQGGTLIGRFFHHYPCRPSFQSLSHTSEIEMFYKGQNLTLFTIFWKKYFFLSQICFEINNDFRAETQLCKYILTLKIYEIGQFLNLLMPKPYFYVPSPNIFFQPQIEVKYVRN